MNFELYTADVNTGEGIVLFHSGHSVFSNFFRSSLVVDGQTYSSVEQYYQAAKAKYFNDAQTTRRIMATASPARCKQLGRAVNGYDSREWRIVAEKIMLKGVYEKFLQDAEAREKLLDTDSDILAEASRFDQYWGIGLAIDDPESKDLLRWDGLNKMGIILMIVRYVLRDVR